MLGNNQEKGITTMETITNNHPSPTTSSPSGTPALAGGGVFNPVPESSLEDVSFHVLEVSKSHDLSAAALGTYFLAAVHACDETFIHHDEMCQYAKDDSAAVFELNAKGLIAPFLLETLEGSAIFQSPVYYLPLVKLPTPALEGAH